MKKSFWITIICLFSYLMSAIVFQYTGQAWDIDFLLSKYKIVHQTYYKVAFMIHIYSSLVILISGGFLFLSFSNDLIKSIHRIIGKVYVVLLLLLAAPSGLIMACHANGGFSAKVSFIFLTFIWWWSTYQGYVQIRRGNISNHRKWMIRSYALTLSAITLRVMQTLIDPSLFSNHVSQYVFVSWFSWIFNLAAAECIIRTRTFNFKTIVRSIFPLKLDNV